MPCFCSLHYNDSITKPHRGGNHEVASCIPDCIIRVRRDRIRPDDAERHHRRRPEHGRLRQQLPCAQVRGDEPRRESARGRHGSRRRGLAKDLRKTVGATEGRDQRMGCRRCRDSPAGVGDDGEREAPDALSRRCGRGQARVARYRQERTGRQRRWVRPADVPQPDCVRLQPGPGEGAAEVVRPN